MKIENAEDITYASLKELGDATLYTDHIHHFGAMFAAFRPKTFLEWGCGFSTKIFLDNSDVVYSVEFDTPGTSLDWLRQCQKLFANYQNWHDIVYPASEELYAACAYRSGTNRDFDLADREQPAVSYTQELDNIIKRIAAVQPIDVSFVDPNIYLRGDLVELSLQNQIPVVIAHDYQSGIVRPKDVPDDYCVYGWPKIKSHPEYTQIYIDHGAGTMFWIHENLADLRDAMLAYQEKVVAEKEALKAAGNK